MANNENFCGFVFAFEMYCFISVISSGGVITTTEVVVSPKPPRLITVRQYLARILSRILVLLPMTTKMITGFETG